MRKPDYAATDAASWNAVDQYFADALIPQEAAREAIIAANAAAGLPFHDVSPLQGQLLSLLVQISGAKRVLEIGTLGAYSTVFMAKALPDGGTIVTIEASDHHATVAAANIARSGVSERIDLRIGKALDVLPGLDAPFDLIFIDADKPNNPHYIRQALRLSRPGTIIVGDNVVRGGAVADPQSQDPNVIGVRDFVDIIAAEPRLVATAIQTVGEKGWDGFVLARVSY